jgi:hypothetical protein
MSREVWIAKIADHKVIGFGFAEAWKFEIGAAHSEAFAFQPPYEVVTDKAASPTHQYSFFGLWFRGHPTNSFRTKKGS